MHSAIDQLEGHDQRALDGGGQRQFDANRLGGQVDLRRLRGRKRPAAAFVEPGNELPLDIAAEADFDVMQHLAVLADRAGIAAGRSRLPLGAAELGEALGDRAGVKPRPEQPRQRLAMRPDKHGIERLASGWPRTAASSLSVPRRGSRRCRASA